MPLAKSTSTANNNNFNNAAFPMGSRPVATKATAAAAGATRTPASNIAPNTIQKRSSSNTGGIAPGQKISQARYDTAKCADPFATNNKKCKTSFSQSYIQGNIPARLQSSAAKYQIQWEQYAAEGFSPDLLVVCADGLTETVHPHVLMAPMMFEELLNRTQGCSDMLAPIFLTLIGHLRKALLDSASTAVGVKATLQLVQASSGQLLLPQLPKLIPALAQALRTPNAKKFQDQIMMIFGLLEQQCGPEATKMIKAKIPTYS